MLRRAELEAIFEAALVGYGVAESREDLRASRSRGVAWPDIIASFVPVRLGTSAGGPEQVGKFLRFCADRGYLGLTYPPS